MCCDHMLPNTLDNNSLDKINDVLGFVRGNPHSSFYKEKYGDLASCELFSYGQFTALPLLTKDDILSKKIKDRTLVPEADIKYHSFSSGTTKNNRPTIIPHASFYDDPELYPWTYNEDEMRRSGATRILILMSPLSAPFFKFLSRPKKYTLAVPGDISNPKFSARLCQDMDIDGVTTSATALDDLINELEQSDFDFKKIKWILLGAEHTSAQKYAFYRNKFPAAFINFRYGNSEFGGQLGFRCRHLAEKFPPSVFHPSPHAFFEIIDETGRVLPIGETGEIVLTDLCRKAFPLIRYKTGDAGRMEKFECPCGREILLHLGGKVNFNFLRFHGVTLYSQIIENSLGAVSEYTESAYQMHVYEKKSGSNLQPQLELRLKLKPGYRHLENDENFKNQLARSISASLHLAPQKTLEYFVREGIFLPLSVNFSDPLDIGSGKAKNIISHLD